MILKADFINDWIQNLRPDYVHVEVALSISTKSVDKKVD
jgi:hypothetical protein